MGAQITVSNVTPKAVRLDSLKPGQCFQYNNLQYMTSGIIRRAYGDETISVLSLDTGRETEFYGWREVLPLQLVSIEFAPEGDEQVVGKATIANVPQPKMISEMPRFGFFQFSGVVYMKTGKAPCGFSDHYGTVRVDNAEVSEISDRQVQPLDVVKADLKLCCDPTTTSRPEVKVSDLDTLVDLLNLDPGDNFEYGGSVYVRLWQTGDQVRVKTVEGGIHDWFRTYYRVHKLEVENVTFKRVNPD